MSTTHDEKRLRFTFDAEWRVLKWDDHPAFIDGLQHMDGTKAVDFVGLHRDGVWFIEVKDFRGHRIENKGRLRTLDLAREVACKVRDTLAALIWACNRAPLDDGGLGAYVKPAVLRSDKVPVVLWLEEDRPDPALRAAVTDAIKRELVWLNVKVTLSSWAEMTRRPFPGSPSQRCPEPRALSCLRLPTFAPRAACHRAAGARPRPSGAPSRSRWRPSRRRPGRGRASR